MATASEPLFLGLDLGTRDLRGLLVTANGRVMAQAHLPLPVATPGPGLAEQDPQRDWWDNLLRLIPGLLAQAKVPAAAIAGLGVCGLFPVACLVDAAGEPVGPAWLYSDQRAASLMPEVAEATGRQLVGDEVLPKLLWLKREAPSRLARVCWALSAAGYVVYRLTGRAVIDPHNAYRYGGVSDATGLGWRSDVLARLGLPVEILPPVAPHTEIVGQVTERAAEATGLARGTPVITGATDTLATLLGHGVLEPGDAMLYYGSTTTLTVLTRSLEQTLRDPAGMGPDVPYHLALYLLSTGAALSWVLDLLTALGGPPARPAELYSRLDAAAAALPPGAGGLLALPYLAGQPGVPAFEDWHGVLAGLSLEHGAAHLWRSLLEAPGYALLDRLQEPLPQSVKRLVAAGGGARSQVWRTILTDMLGVPQHYVPGGSGALGAAFLAALGTGHADRVGRIRTQWLPDAQAQAPDPAHKAAYQGFLADWQRLKAATRHPRA